MIYKPIIKDDYAWINTYKDEDYEVFASFDGKPVKDTWEPVRVRRVRADETHGFEPSDFPWLGSDALVMRRKAFDSLRDIFLNNGEVLPLATDDDVELFVFNATVVDALDEAHSTIVHFPNSNAIMRVKQYEFLQPKVAKVDVFRLPFHGSPTFVSSHFVDRYDDAGLVGLDFDLVWDGP